MTAGMIAVEMVPKFGATMTLASPPKPAFNQGTELPGASTKGFNLQLILNINLGVEWRPAISTALALDELSVHCSSTRYNQLPDHLVQTLKITACLEIQADGSTIDILNSKQQVPFNMQDAPKLQIKEGE